MRYYYTDLSDSTLCGEHMAEALGSWFPDTAEKHKGAMWNYHGWDCEELIAALLKTGEIVPTNVRRLGTRMGSVEQNCESLH